MIREFAGFVTIEHYESYILLIDIKDLRRVRHDLDGEECSTRSKPGGTKSDPLVIAFPDAQKAKHDGRKLVSMQNGIAIAGALISAKYANGAVLSNARPFWEH